MFDIGFSEIVLIGIVALLVVDPKDLPQLMFKAGRFFRQFKLIMSRVSDTVGDVMHELEVESYRQDFKAKTQLIDSERAADQTLPQLTHTVEPTVHMLPLDHASEPATAPPVVSPHD